MMEFLIIESDSYFRETYQKSIGERFKKVNLSFENNPGLAIEFIEHHPVDLAIIECNLPGYDLFALLPRFRDKNIPVILTAYKPDTRLIVEGMRAGAMDFISKNEFDTGILLSVITRVILETDRWIEINKFASQISYRSSYFEVDFELKSIVNQQNNSNAAAAARSAVATNEGPQALQEGKEYEMTFMDIQLTLLPTMQHQENLEQMENTANQITNHLIRIIRKAGGTVWSRKSRNLLIAYVNKSRSEVLHCAIEIWGYMQLLRCTRADLLKDPTASIGLSFSPTIYHENKDEVYSEALNLTAHIVQREEYAGMTIVTENFYENLSKREQRYFQPAESYTNYKLFKFVYLR